MRGPFVLVALLIFSAFPSAVQAACPRDIEITVTHAKAALARSEPATLTDQDRTALTCLAEAVGTLNAKLNALIAGKIAFTGPVTSEMGFIHQGDKSATEEAP